MKTHNQVRKSWSELASKGCRVKWIGETSKNRAEGAHPRHRDTNKEMPLWKKLSCPF